MNVAKIFYFISYIKMVSFCCFYSIRFFKIKLIIFCQDKSFCASKY